MHEIFLREALQQAELGRGCCAPNPSVGAVAVRDNEILAVGYHQGPGTAHAEQVVLSQLTPGLSGVTLYVTLEPCNHWGRTPPCVDAIIAYGVQQVVYSYGDLNPVVQMKRTTDLLAAAGIQVEICPLPEIDCFYESYAHWLQTKRPWVTVKLAQSLDGKIATGEKRPIQLSNAACAAFTHAQRRRADMLLTTAATILSDDPQFTARCDTQPTQSKRLAILDRQLRVPPTAACIQGASAVWIFHDEQLATPERTLQPASQTTRTNACYVSTPTQQDRLNLSAVLDELGRLGCHDVWVEAGSTLFMTLHALGLVNRTHLYVTPHFLGQAAWPTCWPTSIFNRQNSVSWRVLADNAVLTIDWLDEGKRYVG